MPTRIRRPYCLSKVVREVFIYNKLVHHLLFRHVNCNGISTITSIDVKIQGACQILGFIPYKQRGSHFKPVDPPSSLRSCSSLTPERFQVATDMNLSVNTVSQFNTNNSVFHSSTASLKNWPIWPIWPFRVSISN